MLKTFRVNVVILFCVFTTLIGTAKAENKVGIIARELGTT
jgi:hypothetical protein